MDLKIIVFLQFDSLYLWLASRVSEVPAHFCACDGRPSSRAKLHHARLELTFGTFLVIFVALIIGEEFGEMTLIA